MLNASPIGVLAAAIALVAGFASAQTTYTFNTASGAFGTPANWTPARTVPATNDILAFNANATATGLATESIGKIVLSNNAAVVLDGTTGLEAAITLAGGTNVLEVPAGTSLRLNGGGGAAGAIAIIVDAASSATIGGDIIFGATAASTPHRLEARAANQIIFASGSTAAMSPTTTGAANGFGGSAQGFDGGVVFQSGSSYSQGGLKDGTRQGGTGSNPFARTTPASNVVFQPGSQYVGFGIALSVSGRTYASYIHRDGYGAARTVTGGNPWTLTNDLRFLQPSGTLANAAPPAPGSFGFNVTSGLIIGGDFEVAAAGASFSDGGALLAASNFSVAGDFTIENPNRFSPNATAFRTYLFNGTAQQTLDANGTRLTTVDVNNAAGIVLTSPLTVSTGITTTAGAITTSDFGGLILGGTATSPAGYTGPVGSYVAFDATLLTPVTAEGVTYTQAAAGTGATGTFGTLPIAGPATGLPGSGNVGGAKIWVINTTGVGGALTGTISINYADLDIAGVQEATLLLAQFNGSAWVDVPATLNAGSNTITTSAPLAPFGPLTVYGVSLVPPSDAKGWNLYK